MTDVALRLPLMPNETAERYYSRFNDRKDELSDQNLQDNGRYEFQIPAKVSWLVGTYQAIGTGESFTKVFHSLLFDPTWLRKHEL